MSELLGKGIFFTVLGSGSLLVLLALVWGLTLGLRRNRRTSGNRDMYTGHYEIRGTVNDTMRQIEKNIRDLYKEPMEITRVDNEVTFIRLEPQPIFKSLRQPFENLVFKLEEKSNNIISITYSADLRSFRRNVMLLVLPLILLVTVPVLIAVPLLIANAVFPAFLIQGDLTDDVISIRRHILHIFQIVHVIWPPYLILFMYAGKIRTIREEFERFLNNIQVIV
ncbi:hypothetical protein ACFL4W_00090 [Planctomycetota bacterium]